MAKRNKTKRIALCMNLNDFYEHGIARGVVKYSKQHPSWKLYGYGWMFSLVKDILHWQGEGIISRVESTEDEARLMSTNLPVVDVAGAYTDNEFQQVNNNDYMTGEFAAEHFLSRGFTNFAFVGVAGTTWSENRKNGFLSRINVSNLPMFEKSLVWWEKQQAIVGLKKFLQKLPKPCAIFACNDTAGVKITSLCKACGIAVPQTISVMGVDNEDVLCELSDPSLSSIPCDCESIGYQAAAALDKMIRGKKKSREILIPPKSIIIRDSSDIFNNTDPLVAESLTFIHANIDKGINVNDIVRQFDLSRRNLEMRFKKHTGLTLHASITGARMETTAHLLKQTNLTMRAIATKCGFRTLQQFYRKFRQVYSQTPTQFRRKYHTKAPTATS